MIVDLTGENLPRWVGAARDVGLPGITSFAKGPEARPRRGHQRPNHEPESGPVEGRGNHIKMIKRQLSGRASPPLLLRKRVLLTAATETPPGPSRNIGARSQNSRKNYPVDISRVGPAPGLFR
jgi:hypothetical protein